MAELKDTVDGMCSSDYKERLLAERQQLEIRIDKLESLLGKWADGNLDFEPDCPRELLERQLASMGDYLECLYERESYE